MSRFIRLTLHYNREHRGDRDSGGDPGEAMKITEQDIYSETNRLAFLATTAIERAMKRRGLNRSDVADRLAVPLSRVTKVLDGETNMTLKTLASFGLACGVRWNLKP